MVQTPRNLDIISQEHAGFVGKPLHALLKEIKPEITLVLPREGWLPEVAPLFIFFFVSMDVYKEYRRLEKFPLRLRVYVRDPFVWEREKRKGYKDPDHYLDWTKEDADRYGNLIVTAISRAGEYNECDYLTR